jgi:hypothetical protein
MPATPDYDVIKIRDFLVKRIDLQDFCFNLAHRLNERYTFRFLTGQTPHEKSMALVETGKQVDELGEVIFHLAQYWLEDRHGKSSVLVDEGIAEQLALYGEFLAATGDTARCRLVAMILLGLPGRQEKPWEQCAAQLPSPALFTHGYAALIGVGDYADAKIPALPATVNDVKALAAALEAPQHCAYPPEQVHLATGPGATRQSILNALDWLARHAAQDHNSTVLFYFSGHGWSNARGSLARYHLLPYDCDLRQPDATTVDDDLLTRKLAAIRADRLVIILDACHAGGMTKDASWQPAFTPAAPSTGALLAQLGGGRGRVIISSSQENESSYILKARGRSVFTHCLVEALSGAATSSYPDVIGILDVFNYLDREVPRLAPRAQHPVLDGEKTQNFPVARRSAR